MSLRACVHDVVHALERLPSTSARLSPRAWLKDRRDEEAWMDACTIKNGLNSGWMEAWMDGSITQ
eukprot:3185652-Pyramimonas_sp.AAC.1